MDQDNPHRQAPRHDLAALLDVMRQLRTPETGCPWDREQTFETIAPYTLEEAYEVADAIERGDLFDLRDELGDLLFQVVYHAQMAAERGAFDFADVVHGITAKMIRRHPHVFGDLDASDPSAVKGLWERIKAAERATRSADKAAFQARLGTAAPPDPVDNAEGAKMPALLGDVPVTLPGLVRAAKLQARAARVGFDWPDLTPVLDKAEEELGELKDAVHDGNDEHAAEELGDLLFVLANVARHLGRDGETVLRAANAKFVRRWSGIERLAAARGLDVADLDLAALDGLWDEVKTQERSDGGGRD